MSRRKQPKPRHIETEEEIACILQNGKWNLFVHGLLKLQTQVYAEYSHDISAELQ